MMSVAARLAELHSAENLVTCWVREVGRPADDARFVAIDAVHELRLRLRVHGRRRELRVHVARPTLIGGFTMTSMPRLAMLDGDMSIRPLDVQELTEILLDDLAQRQEGGQKKTLHPELATLVADSRKMLERILAAPHDQADAGMLGAEQSLIFGHPTHPSPKSRLGFTPAELDRYSPELGARFRLHLVSARRELTIDESLESRATSSFDACAEDAIGAPLPHRDGHVLIPVHPFQARKLRETPEFRLLLDRGDLVDLGPHGEEVWACSSVRTVQRPGASFALKTSLDVRVTNCLRRNAVHEMQSALQVARWMRAESARLRVVAPNFTALDEVAFVSLLARDEFPSLGVLARDVSPCRAASPAEEPKVAAALFGDRHLGRERIARLLPKAARARFFRGYLEALVVPALHLFFEVGLMFEPHLQNVLVTMTGTDAPRVFLRDFDNAKVVEGIFDEARMTSVLPTVAAELRTPLEAAFDRFVYCLFVNDVAEVAAALADGDGTLERALARDAAEVVASFRDRSGNPRAKTMLDALLSSRTLPAKANLLTRAFKHKDREAPFVAVPNPLREGLRPTVVTPTPTRATFREDSGQRPS